MRRKDHGSPKVVTLAQKKREESDLYLNREKLENSSLVEQMKRWLNIPKSRHGRNEKLGQNSDSHTPIRNSNSTPPHRQVQFHSPYPYSDYEAENAKQTESICSFAPSFIPEQPCLPMTSVGETCNGISDTVTYNCMKRSDVHRRIQDLKKLKRSKRRTLVKFIIRCYIRASGPP